jgi:hypothetical protein
MSNKQQLLLGEGAGGAPAVFIEDVFSTYLYTGNGSTQTITNGIDLSTKGGLVWLKARNNAQNNFISDTVIGRGASRCTNSTSADAAETLGSTGIQSFNSTGFTVNLYSNFGSGAAQAGINNSANNMASWTFRKQPKFFDVVTYTGTGSNRTIAHTLGSVPGCIIVKRTDAVQNWVVQHRSAGGGTQRGILNSTLLFGANAFFWNNTDPTSTVFTVGTSDDTNASGSTYVAYLFAHDAGGFGLSGTDNVISCGSYTGNGSATGPTVTLSYEPQWLLIKRTDTTGDWNLIDNMRGFVAGGADAELNPNSTNAESTGTFVTPTATGFQLNTTDAGYNANTGTYIYIAIRRGPMKVPTSGTSVFSPIARSGTSATATITAPGFAPDSVWVKSRSDAYGWYDWDKLRGVGAGRLAFNTTGAEQGSSFDIFTAFTNTGYTLGPDTASSQVNASGSTYINYALGRAPGFFDVVCYTGTGSNTTVAHNLAAVPELVIVKGRSGATAWQVYSSALANTEYLVLNTTAAKATGATRWNSTTPTSTVFSIGTASEVNTSTATYVAYLFATAPGVSKVGSYTGTGTTLQINCGFTAGARFVLIKRTDSTGDWYVWDSARGIVAGNDSYLVLNSTAAEVTTTDWVDTHSAGFELSSAAGNNANINGASYIFLSVA